MKKDGPLDEWTTNLRKMVEKLPQTSAIGNLYATRAGQIELAANYSRILDIIDEDRKRRGSIRPGLARPNDVKRAVIEALRECETHSLSPPAALVDLVERLFASPTDENRRGVIKRPKLLIQAAKVHVETGLKGRALARERRDRGIDAKDRTIATYEKEQRFIERVKALQKR
jgi:hypothetical protein